MIIAIAAVVVGAIAQRVAGLGFAMMVAPFLILVFGPSQGVVLVLLWGIAASLVNLWAVRHHIDWAVFARMLVPRLLGVALGSLILTAVDVSVFRSSSESLCSSPSSAPSRSPTPRSRSTASGGSSAPASPPEHCWPPPESVARP